MVELCLHLAQKITSLGQESPPTVAGRFLLAGSIFRAFFRLLGFRVLKVFLIWDAFQLTLNSHGSKRKPLETTGFGHFSFYSFLNHFLLAIFSHIAPLIHSLQFLNGFDSIASFFKTLGHITDKPPKSQQHVDNKNANSPKLNSGLLGQISSSLSK